MGEKEEGMHFDVNICEPKDLPQRVSIKKDKAYIERATAWHPIYFDLLLESKINKDISIQSIRCRVKGNDAPLQVIDWKQGDEFATNGLELRGIRPLPALGEIRISMPFNQYMCSKLPEKNMWGLDGFIEFETYLGNSKNIFKTIFSSNAIMLNKEDWLLFPSPFEVKVGEGLEH